MGMMQTNSCSNYNFKDHLCAFIQEKRNEVYRKIYRWWSRFNSRLIRQGFGKDERKNARRFISLILIVFFGFFGFLFAFKKRGCDRFYWKSDLQFSLLC
jgi:hypothetical protein